MLQYVTHDRLVITPLQEALDYLSRPFHQIFLQTLLPLIVSHFKNDTNWLATESSLLALGCVAIGQYREMQSYLADLVPFLFDLTRHPRPLIRSITCWALSRYSLWILRQVMKCVVVANNNRRIKISTSIA